MNRRILVVDDSPATIKFVAFTLRSKGYEVLKAYDGMEALEVIAREPLDLILLDIMMPEMNGLDVLEQVRTKFPHKDVPVILVTSEKSPEDIERGLGLGATDYIAKPFKPHELLEVVGKTLGE